MKGLENDPHPRQRTVALHEETTCISPLDQFALDGRIPDWEGFRAGIFRFEEQNSLSQ